MRSPVERGTADTAEPYPVCVRQVAASPPVETVELYLEGANGVESYRPASPDRVVSRLRILKPHVKGEIDMNTFKTIMATAALVGASALPITATAWWGGPWGGGPWGVVVVHGTEVAGAMAP